MAANDIANLFDEMSGYVNNKVGTVPIDFVLQSVNDFAILMTFSTYRAITDYIYAPVMSAVTLSFIFLGASMTFGITQYPWRDFWSLSLKSVAVLYIVFNSNVFTQYVYEIFFDWGDRFGAVVLGPIMKIDNLMVSTDLLGTVWQLGLTLSDLAYREAGAIVGVVYSGVTMISIVILTYFAIGLLALAKFAMAASMMLAPIFVSLLIFEPTRGLFNSWLQQTMNYVVMTVLTYVAIGMFMYIYMGAYKEIVINREDNGALMGVVASMIFISALATKIMSEIPSIASGLVGGFQIGMSGNTMGRITQSLKRNSANAAANSGRARPTTSRTASDRPVAPTKTQSSRS